MQKQEAIEDIELKLDNWGYNVVYKDDTRPWGGFFVIDESQVEKFATQFFADQNMADIRITEKLSPKILLVAPGQRLSWQYHHRRAEIWKCIGGSVGVITSDDNIEKIQHVLNVGDTIKLKQGERHRLIGLEEWGFVAEIWQHTDNIKPSDEDDIVRIQDDFGR